MRTIVAGNPLIDLWSEPARGDADTEGTKGLLNQPSYQELEQHIGECGKVSFAEASVAVPFVGAATGVIVIAQAVCLASLQAAPIFLQMELGAPDMATLRGLTNAPEINPRSYSVGL